MTVMTLPARATLLLLATVLTGCIEPGVTITQPVEGVTVDEANYLGQVLTVQAVSAGLTLVPATDGVSITAGVSEQLTFESNCPVSGTVESTVAFAGQFDGRTGVADLEFNVVQTHSECLIQGVVEGTSITMNGAPTSSGGFILSVQAGGSYEVNGTIQGAFSWVSGARAGACPYQMNFAGTGTGLDELAAFNLQGAVCGIPIVRSVTFQPA